MEVYDASQLSDEELIESIGASVAEDITNSIIDKSSKHEPKKPVYNIDTEDFKDICVSSGLIPKSHRDAWFDGEKVEKNLKRLKVYSRKKHGKDFIVPNKSKYISLIDKIISDIAIGIVPTRSYLIGAPNGFGKESFVVTCLKIMALRGMRAAPYISLLELAELQSKTGLLIQSPTTIVEKVINEKRLDSENTKEDTSKFIYKCMIGNAEKEIELERYNKKLKNFSWSDYMNADILFCFFTEISNKNVESAALKSILSIRSSKGLPTIALISTSVEPYILDDKLWDYIWSEIYLDSDFKIFDRYECLDRVLHIKTYKQYSEQVILAEEEGTDNDEADA